MIQTEPPYFHPIPKASQPLNTGIFRDDLTFDDCDSGSATYAVSWAVGILDSEPVYMLGAGLYSWFSGYSQDCVKTEKCQQRGFQIEQSNDVWIYNLRTKAIVEMVSPVGELVTRAVDSRNGFLSSILAWVRNSPDTIIGERKFDGFQIYRDEMSQIADLTPACQTAIKQRIKCQEMLEAWQQPKMRGSLETSQGQNFTVKSAVTFPARAGGTISTGYNETCLKETDTGAHCNNVIDTFKIVDSYERMPQNELCSQCFVNTNRMMQSSPCSIFQSALESPYLKAQLQYIHSTCGIGTGPTHVEDPQYLPIKQHPIPCFTEVVHTSQVGDTCDSVALKYSTASAASQSAKTDYITNCTTLAAGNELCIPLTCDNLLSTVWVHGRTLCLSPQSGIYNVSNPIPGVVVASGDSTGYTSRAIPPPGNGTVANSTTLFCGGWHTITSAEETSAKICISNGITSDLFYQINPSLAVSGAGDCTTLLKVGITYCVGPIWSWADLEADISHMN